MTATGTLWASGTPTTTGSTWTTVTNAAGTNNATFAVFTNGTSGNIGTISLAGYGAQTAIGAQPQSVDSVVVTAYTYEATTSRWSAASAQLYDGAAPLGSPQALTLSATSTNSQALTFTGVATWANLANLNVVLSATKSGSVSSTFSVDAAGVVVNYTPAIPPGRSPARFSPLHSGPNWRRSFRNSSGPRYSGGAQTLPVLGCNDGTPWGVFNSAVGPVYGIRGYNTSTTTVPASWPGPDVVIPAQVPAHGTIITLKPDLPTVLSGAMDAALATFFSTVPAGAFIDFWHEGEIHQPAYAPADLIAGHTRVYGIFSASAPPTASYGQVVSTYSASAGLGYPLGQWICSPANGGALLDYYGMDVAALSATSTFEDSVNAAIAAMTGAGVPATGPWTFPEVGYTTAWKGSQSQWYSDGFNVAQALGIIHFFPFFYSDFGEPFWPAPSTDVLRVLQDVAAISRGDPRGAAAQAPARSTTAAYVSSASSTGLTATFGSNPAAGSKVLVAVAAGQAATLAVTDNGTTPATFRLDASCLTTVTGLPSVWIYRADNITLPGAGTYAVSVTRSPSGGLQLAACAYTGVENGPPTATSAVTTSGSSIPALYPVVPADVASLFFSAFVCDSSLNPEGITVASPEFTPGPAQTNGASYPPGAIADALVTTPAPRAGGWNLTDAPDWTAAMAAYSAFPAAITIVPGAQAVWAQAPTPAAGVSASAGLASASGWAAVNAPSGAVTANAVTASAAGAANGPAAQVSPVPATAAATGAATAAPVTLGPAEVTSAATGAALTPAAQVSVTPAAAAATGAVTAAPVTLGAAAATAAASGAAPAPAVTVTATAGLAAASGTANAATAATGISPTGATAAATGAALGPLLAAQPALAAGAAQQPAVTIAAAAALASASGWAAVNAPASASPTPAAAAAAGAALFDVTGSTVSLTLTAVNPVGATAAALDAQAEADATAGLAAATGTAGNPYISATGLARGTGAAQQPAVTIAAAAGLAVGTGAAPQPTAATGTAPAAGLASATGAGVAPAAQVSATPAAAAATGAALAPAVTITASAALAAGTGAAPTPAATVSPAPARAPATGAALAPAVTITAAADIAAATGAALNAIIAASGGLAAATGAALVPTATVSPAPAAAGATGTARTPVPTVTVTAATAAATAASPPSAATTQPAAGLPAATGHAFAATTAQSAAPAPAAAAGAALGAAVFTTGAVFAVTAAGTGTGEGAQAPYTVGALTAFLAATATQAPTDEATNTLTASTAPASTITA